MLCSRAGPTQPLRGQILCWQKPWGQGQDERWELGMALSCGQRGGSPAPSQGWAGGDKGLRSPVSPPILCNTPKCHLEQSPLHR